VDEVSHLSLAPQEVGRRVKAAHVSKHLHDCAPAGLSAGSYVRAIPLPLRLETNSKERA